MRLDCAHIVPHCHVPSHPVAHTNGFGLIQSPVWEVRLRWSRWWCYKCEIVWHCVCATTCGWHQTLSAVTVYDAQVHLGSGWLCFRGQHFLTLSEYKARHAWCWISPLTFASSNLRCWRQTSSLCRPTQQFIFLSSGTVLPYVTLYLLIEHRDVFIQSDFLCPECCLVSVLRVSCSRGQLYGELPCPSAPLLQQNDILKPFI